MCFAPQRCALFRHLNVQKWSGNGVLCTFWLGNVLRAATACTFLTSPLPKVVRSWCVLYLLTWKCASRHNGVHFFGLLTPKSGPNWDVLCILTLKCASRHNGVQFFISHLAKWLRTPTFRPSRSTNHWKKRIRAPASSFFPLFRPLLAPNHWKNTVNRDFPTSSRSCIFFLLTLSLLWSSHFFSSPLWLFPRLLFHLSILSEVWLLNFLRYIYIYIEYHRYYRDRWDRYRTDANIV